MNSWQQRGLVFTVLVKPVIHNQIEVVHIGFVEKVSSFIVGIAHVALIDIQKIDGCAVHKTAQRVGELRIKLPKRRQPVFI